MKKPTCINHFIQRCAQWEGVSFIQMVRMIIEQVKWMNSKGGFTAWKDTVRAYVELGLDSEEAKAVLKYFEYHYA